MIEAAAVSRQPATSEHDARVTQHVALEADRVVAPRPRPFLEFLAVGGLTVFLFPLSWAAQRVLGLDAAELAVGFTAFHAAHLINDPHFAVTYLLFYRNVRDRAFGAAYPPLQRARYWLAGFAVPLALTAWALLAIGHGSARALGWMMELMFALVGWHYVKQGFGVLLVLSARRGVRFTIMERRALLAHCLSAWGFAWANPSTAARDVEEKGVVYGALAHPHLLELCFGVLFALSGLALAVAMLQKLRREKRLPPIAASLGFLLTIWLWTIYSSIDPLIVYVVPALHSVQYLYFVWLLRRNQARAAEGPPNFGRPSGESVALLFVSAIALGALQFHLAPELLDWSKLLVPSPEHETVTTLGPTPWFASLFAIVNIHHYFMDTVIWRRENPDTQFLYH